MAELIEHPYPDCDRCGINLRWAGSHYHCGGCDSKDVTSMYGHFVGAHWVNGKAIKAEHHHCLASRGGKCDLDNS